MDDARAARRGPPNARDTHARTHGLADRRHFAPPTDRDVWHCRKCKYENFADRQRCHICWERSLGHVLEFGGIEPREPRVVRMNREHASKAMPPLPPRKTGRDRHHNRPP